jgi:hypothetical protein
MNRIGAIALAMALGLLAVVAAAVLVWGAFALSMLLAQAIAGLLGETLAALVASVLLLVGCLIAAQGAVWARTVWDARAGAARIDRRRREIDALRRNAALAHWAPLAERRQVADSATVARWQARYRELLADPRRATFAPDALAGEFLTDAQIDFLLDGERRIVCAHLQPLEQALRAARAPLGEHGPGVLWTEWSLDGPRLLAGFSMPGVAWEVPPSHPRDPEPGRLVCTACNSRIEGGFGAAFPAGR